MRRMINNFISVCFTVVKFAFIKVFHWKSFHFNLIERFSPNVVTEFNKGSNVELGRMVRVHSGTKIKVRPGAKLKIGNNVKINYYCIIACQHSITIGEGTEFGPSVFLYDHDHDYKKGFCANSDEECYKKAPIVIGRNCWIGANTIILRGTTIGNNCVIGAGSVVKGNIPASSVLIQKRLEEINLQG